MKFNLAGIDTSSFESAIENFKGAVIIELKYLKKEEIKKLEEKKIKIK